VTRPLVNASRSARAAPAGLMSIRPSYKICPGDRLKVEVVQPDGTRALVMGKLDKVPSAAGGCALGVVTEAQVKAPTARGVARLSAEGIRTGSAEGQSSGRPRPAPITPSRGPRHPGAMA
jgi:hypothetical protein